MTQVNRWVDDLETYKNTGVLNVHGLNLDTVAQTPTTAGTTGAGVVLVPDSSKNVDTLGIKDIQVGATPVHMPDAGSSTITAAAGASNVSTVTVTIKDGAGNAMTRSVPFEVYASSAADGLTLASAASTGFAVTVGGMKRGGGTTVTQAISCMSSATGTATITLTDTGKATSYLVLVVNGNTKISAQLSSGSYG